MHFSPYQQGFTLIELLVALAIFAVIAVVAYSGLNAVLNTRHNTQQQAQRLAQLQLALARIEQDLSQYQPRYVRDEYGTPHAALSSLGRDLTLLRSGWPNPLQQRRSHLQRLRYTLEDGVLQRWYWRQLDRAQDSQPLHTTILTNVAEIQWRFLNTQQEWQNTWESDLPLPLGLSPDELATEQVGALLAIELRLRLDDWGEFVRIFPVVDVETL